MYINLNEYVNLLVCIRFFVLAQIFLFAYTRCSSTQNHQSIKFSMIYYYTLSMDNYHIEKYRIDILFSAHSFWVQQNG